MKSPSIGDDPEYEAAKTIVAGNPTDATRVMATHNGTASTPPRVVFAPVTYLTIRQIGLP